MHRQSRETIIKRAISWWNERKELQSDLAEIRELGLNEVAAIAAECGVTASQLIAVVKAGRHAADEMGELMQALDIDPAKVAALDQFLYNDMQVVCATCEHKDECRRDLAEGDAGEQYHSYCSNAETLDDLRIRLN